MSLIRFEIRYPDGRKEVTIVDGERALIGNGAHCDIRLPMDQAAYEHVAVEVVGGTVRVETKAYEPPATVNGLPFTQIPLGPETPLQVGGTKIFISFADAALDFGQKVVQKKEEKTSPVLKVLALIVFPLGAYVMMMDDEVEAPPAPAQVPELFAAAPATCPQSSPDQALAFANDKAAVAEGKRERSPFSPQDGVTAVSLYELSAVCYRAAGKEDLAKDADANAKQLRVSITADFRARRIRLEHLLKVGDYELAKRDVQVLRSLTEGKQGQYVTWLAARNQEVKQHLGAKQ